jgi:DNA polymerase alpha subunit A
LPKWQQQSIKTNKITHITIIFLSPIGQHFSKVFGTKTDCLENFLLKRRIMGPCWVEVREPQKGVNASWCAVEATVDDSKLISVCSGSRNLDPPPIVVMSLDIKTRVNKKQEHEVVMISALIHKDVLTDKPTPNQMGRNNIAHFTVARSMDVGPGLPGHMSDQTRKELALGRKNGTNNLKILGSSERGLLQFVMTQMSKYDPDCIVGHNILGHSIDVLMHRMSKLKVSNWSKIGRLNLSQFPRAYRSGSTSKHNFDRLAVGRLIVDTYATAKELIRSEVEYTLKHLSKKFLNLQRIEILPLDVPNYYQSCESILHLQKHTESGCFMALSLMFRLEMLPVTKQLTNLGGCLWSKTLSGGRAERIEYLLLHEFHRRKYIVPDKMYKKKGSGKRGKSKYAGGLVLEPKKGLYDKYVLLLDFNSLYPSIIQEYNICFTTVTRQLEGQKNVDNSAGVSEADQKAAGGDGMSDFVVPDLPDLTGSNNSNGERDWAVLPTLLRTLIQRRSVVKKQLKAATDPVTKSLLNNKQLALKLTANSMYGCLGFQNSRFYASPIAALVTGTGREILQNTCDLAQGMGYDVIYGDTDSIMIYTNSTDLNHVQEIGKKIKKEVNKMYRLLEIEIDGVYKTMLLLKKKKYAAIIVNQKPDGSHTLSMEKKGLDLVRRDWCQLSKDLGTRCLELIMSGKETEEVVEIIHQDCSTVAKQMHNGEIPLEKYTITKSLSKAPKDYPNAKNMPHVMVALGMVKNGRPVNVGDHIPYVICNEIQPGTPDSAKASPAR